MKITVDVRKDRDEVVIVGNSDDDIGALQLTREQARSLVIVLARKLGMKPEDIFE